MSVASRQWERTFSIPANPDARPASRLNSDDWPLLLKGYDKLLVKEGSYTPIAAGHTPLRRPILEHLKYGCLNLDKPANPSSHEVVSWIRTILEKYIPFPNEPHKTGHSGTLDPAVTGVLIVCMNRATRLVKAQQNAGKQYTGIVRFHDTPRRKDVERVVESTFTGELFQRPPPTSNVKRELRVRTVKSASLLEYDKATGLALFQADCEAGTYVRTLCVHYGLMLGVGAHMEELRRSRSGMICEADGLSTLHDLLDASVQYSMDRSEAYLRRVILPMELLLRHYPRLVVKDSCIDALCHGAQLLIPGLLRYDASIAKGDVCVLMSSKGEGIALATAELAADDIGTATHGVVARLKRVLMDRGTYPRRWGLGRVASTRKALITAGLLSAHGHVNDTTPSEWWRAYVDYSGMGSNDDAWKRHSDLCKKRGAAALVGEAADASLVVVTDRELADDGSAPARSGEGTHEKTKRDGDAKGADGCGDEAPRRRSRASERDDVRRTRADSAGETGSPPTAGRRDRTASSSSKADSKRARRDSGGDSGGGGGARERRRPAAAAASDSDSD